MEKDQMDRRFLSVEEVAETFGVSRMTIYRMLKRGQLKGMKFGYMWRIPADSLALEK